MADTTRKKATDVNEPTVTKDKNKEEAIDPKQVKSPKPPLPPRPPGLSKIAPGKRIGSLSKSSQHQKETHQDEDSSRPGRPPPPSHQTSIKTPINSKEGNTTEMGKMCTSEKSFPTGHNRSSQDRNEHHEHVGSQLDAPQVETSSVSEQTQEPTGNNSEHVVTTKKSQPGRPKPFIRSPSIATDDKTNTSSKSSTAPPEKPTPKTHKISPPILPKPELPRGGGKSKSNKPLNVFGKQSPPVQPRTPKSKQSSKPEVLKQARDLVKENDGDRSITSAVKTPSREDTASYSLENSSSEVVSQTTEETISFAPDDVFNEKTESSESSPPTEKHSELEPASQKEIPDTVISPKATDGTVDTEIQPQKLAKPLRPCVPSRKTEDVIDESHDNVTLAEDTVVKPSHTLDSCKGKEGQNENKTEKVASPKPSRPRAPSRDVNEQSYHVMTQEGPNENKTEKVASPKPSRPRGPIRKTEDVMNESHDNSALAKDIVNKPSHTLEPCEDKEGQNVNKTEKVASPKPSRPRGPIRKTEDVINERHVSVTLAEDTVNKPSRTLEPCEDKELQNENKTEKVASPKPSRPRAPIKKPEDIMNESHDTSTLAEDTVNKPSRTLEFCKDKEIQNENKTEKVASSKPSRPRAPSRKTEDIDESIHTSTLGEDTVNKPSRTLEPCEDKEIQKENKTEKVATPKPSRPRAPIRKTEDIIDESIDTSTSAEDTSSRTLEPCKDKELQNENKTEKVASPKPSRLCALIRKTEDIIDESIDTSTLAEDTVNKPSRTLEPCKDKEIQNENKTEKVASSKPSRPRAPSRKTEEIISGDTSKLPENVQPLDQQSCAASLKSASPKPSSPKLSRPSKPARPPQLSKTTEDTESNVDEEENKSLKHKNVDKPERSFEPKDSSIKNPATTDSHRKKPQRPSKPNISTVISKEPVCDSTSSEQKDEPHQTIPSTKPQRPSKPNLPSDLTKTKETLCDSTNDFQDEELSQTVVSNNLCGPEMTVAQKEARQTNQHDIEPATNHLLKKTGSIKPSRPPKPNETKHENSSLETYTHTTEVSKPRPPRPQAPHHENQISVEGVEPMETLPKSQERHHEKQILLDENKSVNTPVKPKRASVTESHEQDKEAALGGEKQAHAMKENKDSVSDIMGGNFKKCSDSEKTISKLSSSVVKGSDIESEERKVDDVFVAKCEETRSKFSEHSNSFKLARPPPPNRASSATKDELGKKEGRQETSENDKSSDRHSVRFRVSSLSKTEVESFNKKDFLEKLKDKGHTRRKSEEDSSVSQVGPKPSRPHPPLSRKTTGTSSEREEVQVEPLNAEVLGNENKSNRLKNVSESEGNDVSPTNKAASLGIISDTTVSKSDKACKNESEIPPTDLLQNTPKKMKRKAPPVPEENSNKNDEVHHEDLVVKESEGTKCETAKQNVTRGEQQDENSVGETDVKTKSEALTDTEEHESAETIENNNEQQHVDEITIEHRVIDKDNEKCAEASVVEQTETIIDKEEPGVKHVCSGTENISAGIAESSDKNVETQEVCEATQSPSSKSSENQHDGNVEKKEIVNVVQSPKKKKTPPPKPKRTSSLKRDSKLIVHKREEEEGERRTGDRKVSSSDGLNEIVEENDTGKPSEAVVPSTKTVKFNENPVEPKSFSKPVSRSKSFASPGNDRAKETNGEDIPNGAGEGISRSFSFSAKIMKKYQPQRPSPPTFFVSETKTDDSANPESANPESEETSKDDVIEVDTSASQEDLAESESSQNNDTKHESCLTTDSESEDGKEEGPQKSKTYYISKEILSTERTFVDVMKLVSEDFKEVVAKGNKKFGRAIIPDETLQEIVMNISQIYKFDSEFLKALEDRMATWEKEERIGDIIKRFSPFLKMYKTYIQGYDNAMAVLTEALKKYPQFAEVVREFESSERCHGLTVGMYMLKPIQRIPSYRLLLIDYLKHLSKDSLDHKDVSDALAIVSEVATHINEDMKRVDNFEEVLKIQRNLVGQVEIVKPGRELIKEGLLMKLSRKEMQPRMFYLLTDVLLYTTPVANNQFRLNLSLPLEEIQVELPVSPDFENEFSIISTKKSFILSASTADERDEWLEALRNASDEIRKKKITFHLAKKEKMEALYDAQLQDDDKELGSKAPVWIPDVRVTMCMVCTDDFTVTNRRHHCRACGKVVCGSCSSNSAPLAYLNDETARVCDICYDELTDKKSSKQTAVEAKENGITTESKDSASKVNPVKKSRKNKFFKSKEVPAVEESTISGYLKTRVGKKWQKKWYVVKDNVLYASKASSDPAAQETRPSIGYDVRGPEKMDGDSKKIVFQLIHAGTEPVVLQTDNLKHGEQWVNALRRATILPL